MRDAGRATRRRAGGARSRPRLRRRHRAGFRDPGPHRLRGALRLRAPSAPSPTSRPGCAPQASRADPRHPAGARRRRGHRGGTPSVGDLELRGFSKPVRAFDVRGLERRGTRMTTSMLPRPALAAARLSPTSTEDAAHTRASTASKQDCPPYGTRCGQDPRRVGRRPPVDVIDRIGARRSGAPTRRYEERSSSCCCCSASRGCSIVYVTSMPVDPAIIEYYLALLPGVIPSHARARLSLVSVGDSSAAPAVREAARPGRGCSARSPPSFPTRPLAPAAVQHDQARTGRRPAARHTHVRRRPRSSPSARRPAPGGFRRGGDPAPHGGRGRPDSSTTSSTALARLRAATSADRPPPSSSSTRVCPGAGNAVVDLAGLPASGDPRSASPCATAC